MEAPARLVSDSVRDEPQDGRVIATALPTLWPHMLIPRSRLKTAPFPFNSPAVSYFHFGRNAIYTLARYWGLAGQEVLFPAYFHSVELEALLAAGVLPRFYPVRDRMRVNPDEIAARVGPQTRAVYLIHYLGFPGPVEEVSALCRDRGLLFIEDCALALLSCVGDRPLGSFGDAAVFCLYKTLPTPHGGALLLRGNKPLALSESKSPSLTSTAVYAANSLLLNLEVRGGNASRLVFQTVRSLGRAVLHSVETKRVVRTQYFDLAHASLGMSRFCRLVLASQDFASVVERRRRNYFHLLDRLREVAPPVLGEPAPGVCPLSYPVQVRNKEAAVTRLATRGIEAVNLWSRHYPAVPPGAFPEVDELRRTVLELPCHQDLTSEAIDRIVVAVRDVMEECN